MSANHVLRSTRNRFSTKCSVIFNYFTNFFWICGKFFGFISYWFAKVVTNYAEKMFAPFTERLVPQVLLDYVPVQKHCQTGYDSVKLGKFPQVGRNFSVFPSLVFNCSTLEMCQFLLCTLTYDFREICEFGKCAESIRAMNFNVIFTFYFFLSRVCYMLDTQIVFILELKIEIFIKFWFLM